MIEFYRDLPYSVEHEGVVYELTPAYDNVLSMFNDVAGLPRMYVPEVMGHYLLANPAQYTVEGLLDAVADLLLPRQNKNTARNMDFIQDGPLIYAAFMQAYRIDLNEERGRLHWWKFSALLRALPADTRFSEVVQIRMRPMPPATKHNAEERAQLARLKAEYSLDISDEERREQLQDGLRGIAEVMRAMAERGKKNG